MKAYELSEELWFVMEPTRAVALKQGLLAIGIQRNEKLKEATHDRRVHPLHH